MRTRNTGQNIEFLCGLFGRTRQAYYQRMNYSYTQGVIAEILLQKIEKQRQQMPRLGGRKLLQCIQGDLPPELRMGRDKFFNFLRENNLLILRRRFKPKTTMSNHLLRKYPNLIRDFSPTAPNQLWVSDITYIPTIEGFVYLFLITDAYSRKIIGYQVSETMEAINAVVALNMALSQLPANLMDVIHHSDRGGQYCSYKYVEILEKNNFKISMTECGDPRENAIAERVNGILKDEWLNEMKLKNLQEAMDQTIRIIKIYNTLRPHSSIDLLTPEKAHYKHGALKRHWKNYWKEQKQDNLNTNTSKECVNLDQD